MNAGDLRLLCPRDESARMMGEVVGVSLLVEVAHSIWKPAAYAEFARQRGRRALVYLVLISLPLALTGAVRAGLTIRWASESAARALAGGPDFRITGGQLAFDAPQPYVIVVEGIEIGWVDTTGATDASYLDGRDNAILLLRDRMVIRNGLRRQEMTYDSLALEQTLTRDGLAAALLRLGGVAWPIGLLWLLGSVLAKLVAALVLGLLAWIVLSARTRSGGWPAAWAVATHALTLPLLLGFVRVLAGVTITAFGLLYWGAAVVYAIAGVSALRPAAPVTPTAAGVPPLG